MTRPAAASQRRRSASHNEPSPIWLTLDRLCLILVAGLVIARATMQEMLRDVMPFAPGQPAPPAAPGPVTTLVFGLLASVPAFVVLLRRSIDRDYRLTGSTPSLLLLALGLLAGISSTWAGDRFGAFVAAAQLVSAAVVMWSTAQLVREWSSFRLVVAVAVGLLLVFVVQGVGYRWLELPMLQERWEQDIDGTRTNVLRARGWSEDDYPAQRFAQKVMAGEMIGFTASANTFAATTVLLAVVTMGLLAHRLSQRETALAVAATVALVGAAYLIYFTYSKTAYLTPLLAAGLLVALIPLRAWMARHRRVLFALGACAFVLGALAVVGHGLYHGSLPDVSLTFRWRYWVAAAAMVADHPVLGVGYANFGNEYVSYRLPAAAEEVRDPHNYLVRFGSELGIVGAAFAVAWTGMLWWRLSRPKLPADPAPTDAPPGLTPVMLAVTTGVLLNLAAAVDWSQSSDYLLIEVLKRLFYLAVLAGGAVVVYLRSARGSVTDASAAPWLVYGVVVAVAVFFLHNLIDFSLFEPGPMHVFALLVGGVLGVRSRSAESDGRAPRSLWLGLTAAVGVAWLVAAVTFAGPVMLAEDQAATGDRLLRDGDPRAAAERYAAAFRVVPSNADYAYRRTTALRFAGAPATDVRVAIDQAIAAEPTNLLYRLTRARLALQQTPPDTSAALADFAHAVERNPHDIDLRWEYAQVLDRAGRPADAAAQTAAALAVNDGYAPDESERLGEARLTELRAFIDARRASP